MQPDRQTFLGTLAIMTNMLFKSLQPRLTRVRAPTSLLEANL
jgi:hypothetical protein